MENQQAQAQTNDPVLNIKFRKSGLEQLLNLIATPDYKLRNAIIADVQAQATEQLQAQATEQPQAQAAEAAPAAQA